LKAAYVRDVQKAAESKWTPMRKKAEFLHLFKWVLGRAQHYAHKTGIPMACILYNWERKRDYWWLNYYQDSQQPRFHSKSLKHEEHKENSKKKKERWPMFRKARGY
jgi:hypothetical protein